MPWQGVCPMELRMRLVNALIAEEDSMTALCEEYGVSRKTGYKWLARFRAQGPAGVGGTLARTACGAVGKPPRRRPREIVALRRQHPSWGPKKLHASCWSRRRSSIGRP